MLRLLIFYFSINLIRGSDDFILTTKNLPSNRKLMPTLGNGNLGFTIFSNVLHLNYIFNGDGNSSHRANVPNYANIQMEFCNPNENSDRCEYTLNMNDGTFRVKYVTDDFSLEQVIFPHRYYATAIVNEFHVKIFKSDIQPTYIKLYHLPDLVVENSDFKFESITQADYDFYPQMENVFYQCGKTTLVEHPQYQTKQQDVCYYWNKIPAHIEIFNKSKTLTFITTVDGYGGVAEIEMSDILPRVNLLYTIHLYEWNNFWTLHDITIVNSELSRIVRSSLFSIANAMRSLDTERFLKDFNGIGSVGLGTDGDSGLIDYETEIYYTLPLVLINPDWTHEMLRYRIKYKNAARDLAKREEKLGTKYPSYSGFTGSEISTDDNDQYFQILTTAAVALSLRYQYSAAFTKTFMFSEGCSMAYELGQYLSDLLQYNKFSGYYEIRNVAEIDHRQTKISNDLITNILIGSALHFGQFSACRCNDGILMEEGPKVTDWIKKAELLKIPFDRKNGYYLPYDDYNMDPIKLRLPEPILLDILIPTIHMNHTIRQNDIKFTESMLADDPKPMVFPFLSMHYLRSHSIHEIKATELLLRIKNYIHGPFMVWSESVTENLGRKNYLPAASSVLLNIIFGWCGIKLEMDRLVFSGGKIPIDADGIRINGLTYMGNRFSYIITNRTQQIEILKVNSENPLQIMANDELMDVCLNCKYDIMLDKITSLHPKLDVIGNCHPPTYEMGLSTYDNETQDFTNDNGSGSPSSINMRQSYILPIMIIFIKFINF